MSVKIPKLALDGIDAVRESGLVDLKNYRQVMYLCSEWGYFESVSWLAENPERYLKGLVEGFEVVA